LSSLAHQALIAGQTALFTTAGQLLGDLAALDSDSTLRRRVHHYARPQLLAIQQFSFCRYGGFGRLCSVWIVVCRMGGAPWRVQNVTPP
jgi:hypothetical protein